MGRLEKKVVLLIAVAVVLGIVTILCIVQLMSLESNYRTLQSQYYELKNQYYSLEEKYRNLESNYRSLEISYNSLKVEYEYLKNENFQLKARIKELEDLLNEFKKVPHGYYNPNVYSSRDKSFKELEQFLTFGFRLPRNYKEGVFDCSESAAYLEWALENAGFDAYIVTGPAPWDPNAGYHAWVIVYTKEYTVAIEPTVLTGGLVSKLKYLLTGKAPGVIYRGDKYENGYYYGYTRIYKNIYEAIENYRSVGEWNWWEGYWGFV
jgi:cell division protein FtsB